MIPTHTKEFLSSFLFSLFRAQSCPRCCGPWWCTSAFPRAASEGSSSWPSSFISSLFSQLQFCSLWKVCQPSCTHCDCTGRLKMSDCPPLSFMLAYLSFLSFSFLLILSWSVLVVLQHILPLVRCITVNMWLLHSSQSSEHDLYLCKPQSCSSTCRSELSLHVPC